MSGSKRFGGEIENRHRREDGVHTDLNEGFKHVSSLIVAAVDPDTDIPAGIAPLVKGVSTSKLYDDGGNRMRFAGEILKRAFMHKDKRWTPEQLQRLCESYFEDITACGMPPTISGLALYLGWTVRQFDDFIVRDAYGSDVLRLSKEAIRLSIEQAALDGTINPLLYFHQQKAYHGVVERNELIVTPIRLDPTPEEVDHIIDVLPDGSVE